MKVKRIGRLLYFSLSVLLCCSFIIIPGFAENTDEDAGVIDAEFSAQLEAAEDGAKFDVLVHFEKDPDEVESTAYMNSSYAYYHVRRLMEIEIECLTVPAVTGSASKAAVYKMAELPGVTAIEKYEPYDFASDFYPAQFYKSLAAELYANPDGAKVDAGVSYDLAAGQEPPVPESVEVVSQSVNWDGATGNAFYTVRGTRSDFEAFAKSFPKPASVWRMGVLPSIYVSPLEIWVLTPELEQYMKVSDPDEPVDITITFDKYGADAIDLRTSDENDYRRLVTSFGVRDVSDDGATFYACGSPKEIEEYCVNYAYVIEIDLANESDIPDMSAAKYSSARLADTTAEGYPANIRVVDSAKGPIYQYERGLYGYGDVDLDDEVTAFDARLALRGAVNLFVPFTETQFLAADPDRDGAITAADARSILRAAIGLENLYAI